MNLRLENSWTEPDGSWEEVLSHPEGVDGVRDGAWETLGVADAGIENTDLWSSARTSREWQAHPDADFRAEFDDFIEPTEAYFPVAERFEDPRRWADRINPRWEGRGNPYGKNCADCARCVERTWRGSGEVAAGLLKSGECTWRVEQWTGLLEDIGGAEVIARLERGGAGSSAYVVSTQKGGWAHAYNLVNYEGEVLLVDGQIGCVEGARDLLDGHDVEHLHPQAWHQAAFWDPEGEKL